MKKEIKLVLLLILLSLPAARYLLIPGFYEPHDLHHFADIYEMYRAITLDQFPPRWAPDFLYNYGYPLFNFYYVLPFYLGAFFHLLGFAFTTSYKLVFVTSIFVSVVGMYYLLREFMGKLSSFTGALVFVYTPYRAVEIYVRGAMGEALALSLLPFVIWILVKLIKNPTGKYIGLASVLLSLFLLAHNYLWFLSAPFIALLLLLLIIKLKDYRKALLGLLWTGLISFGLTAYWLIPAITERKLIDRLTPFLLIDHFPFLKQLIIPSWGYGSSVWGPGDEISFQIGVVNLIVLMAVLILFVKKNKLFVGEKLTLFYWAIVGFFVSVFMMNIRSLPFWKIVPFYDFIQFPWRILFLTTLFTSILAGLLVELTKNKKLQTSAVIVLASIFLTVNYFKPSKVFYKNDNQYLARFFANQTTTDTKESISNDYLSWSEDYLLLPNWSNEKPNSLPMEKIQSSSAKISDIQSESPLKWKAQIIATQSSTVTFNTLFFPGWVGMIDSQNAAISASKPYGQIILVVPEGKHTVDFMWKETLLRKVSDLMSVVSLVVVLYLLFGHRVSNSKNDF